MTGRDYDAALRGFAELKRRLEDGDREGVKRTMMANDFRNRVSPDEVRIVARAMGRDLSRISDEAIAGWIGEIALLIKAGVVPDAKAGLDALGERVRRESA